MCRLYSISAARRLVTLLIWLLPSVLVSAQVNADAMYNKGLKYQGTMTVAAQNEAITYFTKAKKLYDSPKDKNKCDKSIQISINIKKNLGGRTGNASQGKDTYIRVDGKSSTSSFGGEYFRVF